jgi:hypothetical protein
LPFIEDLSKLPNAVIMFYMLAFFLSFGIISNFIDHEGFLYNLSQGAFISVVTGTVLFFARFLSRKRTADKVKLQPINPENPPNQIDNSTIYFFFFE